MGGSRRKLKRDKPKVKVGGVKRDKTRKAQLPAELLAQHPDIERKLHKKCAWPPEAAAAVAASPCRPPPWPPIAANRCRSTLDLGCRRCPSFYSRARACCLARPLTPGCRRRRRSLPRRNPPLARATGRTGTRAAAW